MPGRQYFSSQSYRYGMNGQENDDEITGNHGTHTSAEFWEYDTRLGRRWNTDPIVKYWESPYAAFAGNPIVYADPNGADKEDKRLFDRSSGKQVGYEKDLNGTDYVTDEYGHYAEGGGFVSEKTVTPEDRQAVNNMAKKVETARAPSAHQQAIYNFCDDAPKYIAGTAVVVAGAIAAAPFVAAEAGLIYGFGGTALKATLAGSGAYSLYSAGNGYLTQAVIKGSVDAVVQTVIVGPNNVDVLDVAYSAMLTPFGSAVFGAGSDWKPFSADKSFKTVLGSKDAGSAMVDFSFKLTFGGAGLFKPMNKYVNSTDFGPYFTPIITMPANAGAKEARKLAKETFGK